MDHELQSLSGSDALAHMAACDECLDAALRRAPEVQIPEGFARRVLAELPPQDEPERSWVPAAACAGAMLAGAVLWWQGDAAAFIEQLQRPAVLALAGAVETLGVTAWLWRVLLAEN
jgi:hypothetical protein